MDWTDLLEKLGDRSRVVPASEFRADDPGARQSGLCGWWADETARKLIESTLDTDADELIYVGGTRRSHAKRVGEHLDGPYGKSTLRHSLLAILMEADPAFATARTDPQSSATESIVSDWMRKHLEVTVVRVAPDSVKCAKEAALDHYDPPLNVQGVTTTPARARLSTLRGALPRRRSAGR